MRCIFAASEGASFQAEHFREPRLKLFVAYELSIPAAEKYLQKMYKLTVDTEMKDMLSRLPRTFVIFNDFAIASDKKAFSDSAFNRLMVRVENTLTHPSAIKVYRLAKKQDINILDLDLKALNISEADFEKLFVASDIFTLNKEGVYSFQFGATAAAAERVCKL